MKSDHNKEKSFLISTPLAIQISGIYLLPCHLLIRVTTSGGEGVVSLSLNAEFPLAHTFKLFRGVRKQDDEQKEDFCLVT